MLSVENQFNRTSFSPFQKLIYKDDVKCKEEMIAENEMSESILKKANGIEDHINLMVRSHTFSYRSLCVPCPGLQM